MTGCSNDTPQNEVADDIPEQTFVNYTNVKGQEALDMINNNENITILDVRTPEEYEEGHIENAINIPVDQLESRLSELEQFKNSAILVYCRSGNRSSAASDILTQNNFNKVFNMEDGTGEFDYKLIK